MYQRAISSKTRKKEGGTHNFLKHPENILYFDILSVEVQTTKIQSLE